MESKESNKDNHVSPTPDPPPYQSPTMCSTSTPLITLNPDTSDVPVSVQIQTGLVTPKEKYCGCCVRPVYPLCLTLSLLVWVPLFVVFQSVVLINDSIIIGTMISVFCGIALGFGLFYEIECIICDTSSYLWNLCPLEDFVTMVARLRAEPFRIYLQCSCSHQESRTRTVTSSSRNGTSTRTETYWVTVVTYTEKQAIEFTRWEDVSGELTSEILACNAIRVDLCKTWEAGDAVTQATIDTQTAEFDLRNRSRDVNYKQWIEMEINGFKEKILSTVDLKKRSFGLQWWVYAVLSFVFILSWPYRMWFSKVTAHANYNLKKRIYLS